MNAASILRTTRDGLSRYWLRNSSRVHLERCNREFAQTVSSDMLVLDAGAGTAPYRELFLHAGYETADFEKVEKEYGASTYVCDLTSIPVADGRFDRVVFNQVLEHLPDPVAALRELRRVMKPAGKLICTCPLYYEEHEQPYDFFRYTQFGLRHLFGQAGFTVDHLDWLEGYCGTIGYQLEGMHRSLPVRPRALGGGAMGWLLSPVFLAAKVNAFALAGLFYRVDVARKLTGTGYPKNYVVIASKGN